MKCTFYANDEKRRFNENVSICLDCICIVSLSKCDFFFPISNSLFSDEVDSSHLLISSISLHRMFISRIEFLVQRSSHY